MKNIETKATNSLLLRDLKLNYQNKKIVIVGLGGTALELIMQLVAIDFKNYILVDYDKVNVTNLNRQFLFQKKDVGRLKSEVIEEYIRNNVENSKIVCHNKKILFYSDMSEILLQTNKNDLLVCCADSPPLKIEKILIESSYKNDIAFITAGVGINIGSIGPLLITKRAKKRYVSLIERKLSETKKMEVLKYSDGITNSYISLLLAKAVISYILEIKEFPRNRVFIYEFNKIYEKGIKI